MTTAKRRIRIVYTTGGNTNDGWVSLCNR